MASLRRRTMAPKPRPVSSKSKREDSYTDTCCEECGSGESPSELLLCDKCDCGFHLFCLRPILASVPKGSWFCPSCSDHKKKPKSFPLVQTKIVDFFRIQRSSEPIQKISPDSRKRRKRTSILKVSKKRRKLLAFNPCEDPIRRLEQMASLATALTATGADFRNELTYVPGMAPRSANCAALEQGGMQVLPKEDMETLDLCKNMMERGEWPPLMVVFDPREGFTVEADRFIKDLTIITEYVGDVDYLENRENDDGDSMMTLISAADPSKSLVICPDKRSNIARFINGINNHTPDGKKKQNVKCVRFDVNGECRALLIASRDIPKGERLYYDYNGYEHEYPTEHFV
ncbi:histone-lysine N-methyltransferase ATXR6 isoform X2 [Rhododendron vialii]|uniref:histone-lysine N-methyltransferase ATXR6 isoform X2 n=1 Tax=Rhododendron vialii TaxID=182163 RepID=UPI0026604417|nr:histone-lysine N-methyltransferase ATXR6 isoform X2 [Rhododendron vialii]